MRAVVVTLLALTIADCGLRIADSDRVLLNQFFAASRLRDLTALRKFGTVVFEPARDGIITRFDIVDVVPATRAEPRQVLIEAPVRLPEGRTALKNYAMTIHNGLVTAFSERLGLSLVEGSASPSTPRP